MSAKEKKKRPSIAGKRVSVSRRKAEVPHSSSESAPAATPSSVPASSTTPRSASSPVDAPVGEGASRIEASASSSRTGTPRRQSSGRPSTRKGKRLSRRFVIVTSVIIVLLLVGTGLLAWNHWLRFDDAADIQGSWTVDGTDTVIAFTETDIVMTEEVSYPYTIDTFHKTIDFSFAQYNGTADYAFSPERTTLVLTEKDADSGGTTSTKLVKK